MEAGGGEGELRGVLSGGRVMIIMHGGTWVPDVGSSHELHADFFYREM